MRILNIIAQRMDKAIWIENLYGMMYNYNVIYLSLFVIYILLLYVLYVL